MLTLKVPSGDGGEDEGLNDPGVELFIGDVETQLAREGAQNAIDAAATTGSPVELSFDLMEIDPKTLPASSQLLDVMKACGEYWKADKKSATFFAAAVKDLTQPKINVLRMRDTKTCGLTGGDHDRSGRWYGLMQSSGVSVKPDGSGGSFGIGKYAPFAVSTLRTVLYSTKTTEGKVAFKGITRLASHYNEVGEVTRRTGYIGVSDPKTKECVAVRNPSDIPVMFQREEPGTDVLILGYAAPGGWQRKMVKSILTNFWPAIHRGLIVFRVPEYKIDKSTLDHHMRDCANDRDFEAFPYYHALTAGTPHETILKHLGKVTVYLATSDNFPKHIACTRTPGMVVEWKRFQSRKPFAGYFVCDNTVGNDLLCKMEPPRHDKWDNTRGPDPAVSKKALTELHTWMRDLVKALNPVSTETALDVEGLSRFLPDDADDDKDPPTEEGGKDDPDKAFNRKTLDEPIPTQEHRSAPPIPKKKGVSKTEVLEPDPEGDEELPAGNGEAELEPSPNPEPPPGEKVQRARRVPAGPPLQLRSMRQAGGSYELVIRSPGQSTSRVQVLAVGEVGEPTSVTVVSAVNTADSRTLIANGDTIELVIPKDGMARVRVTLKERISLALTAERA